MLDHIKDVEHLLNYLGIEKFKVMAVSGGGPYALAAAYHFPKSRLQKTLIRCGSTRSKFGSKWLDIRLQAHRFCQKWLPFRKPVEYHFVAKLCADIVQAKGNAALIRQLELATSEESRQESAGYANDYRLLDLPWGFSMEEIDANDMRWYHGNMDKNTSSNAAKETVDLVNRHRHNIDYREVAGLDHHEIQDGKHFDESMAWLRT